MSIKNLLNYGNTAIYKKNKVLGGVFYFSIKSSVDTDTTYGGDGMFEIFSAQPWEISSGNNSYIVTIKVYTKDFEIDDSEIFELKFVAGSSTRTFSGCKIRSQETYVDDSGKLITVSIINAERMF